MQPSTSQPTPEAQAQPSVEHLPPVIGAPERGIGVETEKSPEPVAAPSVSEVSKLAGSSTAPIAINLPRPVQPSVGPAAITVTNLPAVADDVDVIEKEWVKKAKAVVQETADDPHQQNQKLTIVKTDYQRKRYGRGVQLADDIAT